MPPVSSNAKAPSMSEKPMNTDPTKPTNGVEANDMDMTDSDMIGEDDTKSEAVMMANTELEVELEDTKRLLAQVMTAQEQLNLQHA